MSPEEVGTAFIENSGILEAADDHDAIIMFPQVRSKNILIVMATLLFPKNLGGKVIKRIFYNTF